MFGRARLFALAFLGLHEVCSIETFAPVYGDNTREAVNGQPALPPVLIRREASIPPPDAAQPQVLADHASGVPSGVVNSASSVPLDNDNLVNVAGSLSLVRPGQAEVSESGQAAGAGTAVAYAQRHSSAAADAAHSDQRNGVTNRELGAIKTLPKNGLDISGDLIKVPIGDQEVLNYDEQGAPITPRNVKRRAENGAKEEYNYYSGVAVHSGIGFSVLICVLAICAVGILKTRGAKKMEASEEPVVQAPYGGDVPLDGEDAAQSAVTAVPGRSASEPVSSPSDETQAAPGVPQSNSAA